MEGLKDIRVKTKKSDKVCPIHNIPLEYIKGVEPFCKECTKEQIEAEAKQNIDDFKINNVKGVLRRDSLVDLLAEYKYAFDTFNAPEGTKEAQMKYKTRLIAYDYIKKPKEPIHTIMYGTPGEGKTHLAMSMLNAINDNANPPQSCLFIDINELFDRIKTSFDNSKELWTEDYAIKKLSSVDVLVLDDVGSESAMTYDGSEASNFIQRIIKKVLDRQERVIVTTNLTFAQLQKVYNPKIVSRMFAHSKDYRLDFSGIKDKRF